MVTRASILVGILLVLAGCGQRPRALLDPAFAPQAFDIDAWIAAHPLALGQNIQATPLRRSTSSSTLIVQVRDRETPHVHATHDLVVTLLRGCGTFHLGERVLPMRAGDVAVVPMGTPHFFVNEGHAPSVALATFAPAYDGSDQLPVP